MSNVTGRPTLRNPELVDEMLHWIAEGQTLREFCRQPGKPAWRTVYDWLEADSTLSARFARARDMGFDAIGEETLQIADTPVAGEITTVEGDKITKRTEDMLGHRKLQVETRLKLLAKWSPKKYGDKLALGGDADSPIQVITKVERVLVRAKPHDTDG